MLGKKYVSIWGGQCQELNNIKPSKFASRLGWPRTNSFLPLLEQRSPDWQDPWGAVPAVARKLHHRPAEVAVRKILVQAVGRQTRRRRTQSLQGKVEEPPPRISCCLVVASFLVFVSNSEWVTSSAAYYLYYLWRHLGKESFLCAALCGDKTRPRFLVC